MKLSKLLMVSLGTGSLLVACSSQRIDRFPASVETPRTLGTIRLARAQGYRSTEMNFEFLNDNETGLSLGGTYNLADEKSVQKLQTDALRYGRLLDQWGKDPKTKDLPMIGKGKEKALREIAALAALMVERRLDQKDRDVFDAVGHIQELSDALRSNLEPPVDPVIQLRNLPAKALEMKEHYNVAANLTEANSLMEKGEPRNSTFWRQPAAIAKQDLYHGVGRKNLPDFNTVICTYLDKQRGFGTHPRMEVDCGGKEFKVKFGTGVEIGPFGARLYNALGYYAPTVDFTEGVKVRYDHDLFAKFHVRQFNEVKLKAFFLTIKTIRGGTGLDHQTGLDREDLFNAFLFVDHAVLKNGKTITADEFRRLVLKDQGPRGERDEANYVASGEAQVDYVAFKRSSLVHKDEEADSVGNWDYNKFDHPARRELRGLQLVAAWLGNYDHRRSNTRLQLVKNKQEGWTLRHQVSDVDSGLGQATGGFASGLINSFAWEVATLKGTKIEITGLQRYEAQLPFREMNKEDGRWIMRKIAQISENQIRQALIASGYGAPEVYILTEKLVSRRNNLLRAFGLENDPEIKAAKVIRFVSRTAALSEKQFVEATLPDGSVVRAPASQSKLINGRLE